MKISQSQARYYRKKNMELMKVLADQKNRWSTDWGEGWVNIETLNLTPESYGKVKTARALGHAVVVVTDGGTTVRLYAERLP